MTMHDFITEHRDELSAAINRHLNHVPRTASCHCPKSGTDHVCGGDRSMSREELRQWILNDEGLYRWARREGVRI